MEKLSQTYAAVPIATKQHNSSSVKVPSDRAISSQKASVVALAAKQSTSFLSRTNKS